MSRKLTVESHVGPGCPIPGVGVGTIASHQRVIYTGDDGPTTDGRAVIVTAGRGRPCLPGGRATLDRGEGATTRLRARSVHQRHRRHQHRRCHS